MYLQKIFGDNRNSSEIVMDGSYMFEVSKMDFSNVTKHFYRKTLTHNF